MAADPELAEASAAACDNQRQRTQEILAKKRDEKQAAGTKRDSNPASNMTVFLDQCRALLQKDWANQKRQTGTNAALRATREHRRASADPHPPVPLPPLRPKRDRPAPVG